MAKSATREWFLNRKGFRKEVVEIEGHKFEFRSPSAGQRTNIMKAAGLKGTDESTMDPFEFTVLAVLALVFDPETGERMFEAADRDALLSLDSKDFDLLSTVAAQMFNRVTEAAKNSEPTLSASSISA